MSLVEIYSPVVPIKSGTADYLDKVLLRLSAIEGVSENLTIATDLESLPAGSNSLSGIKLVDYRTRVADMSPLGTTRIFALANNRHHAFVQRALEQVRHCAYGKIIALLHEPCVFMLHRWRSGESGQGVGERELVALTAAQYGLDAERLVQLRLHGGMPALYEYVTHGQATALGICHEIWVHSLFAASKLVLESRMKAGDFPRIRVCRHPEGDAPGAEASDAGAVPGERFEIGCFGWITPVKRVESVLLGVALALDRLGAEAAGQVRLSIVGRRADNAPDVAGLAGRYGLGAIVETVEDLSLEAFEARQRRTDLIFNLRYPSCGETSGTLASARGGRARLVASRYQAFVELDALAGSVGTLPVFEPLEIAATVCDTFSRWRAGAEACTSAPRRPSSRIAGVERLILAELAARAVGRRLTEQAETLS